MKQLSVVKKPWVGLRKETQPNDLKMLGFTIVWPNLRSDLKCFVKDNLGDFAHQ